jgi:8-amino-7-oxononanoate synthase
MSPRRRSGLHGITEQTKDQLVRRVLEQRQRRAQEPAAASASEAGVTAAVVPVPDALCRFEQHPGFVQVELIREGARRLGIDDPFFRSHDGIAGSLTQIDGRPYVNFSSYNYLGLNGDPRVSEAARQAIERYGTSVSASRLVSGERPPHQALERALAECYGVEACISFVSGHATNVSTIGGLFGPRDLIVHDALIHNSALLGAQLSGARRLAFPHNDWAALDTLLARERHSFQRALIVLEGLYSMDGDVPDLPRFVEIKLRHRAFLMVDEAHSFGVLGRTGLGIREHFALDGGAVDIWMGTLSKALAGCGGYIAGEQALIDNLKFVSPGFVFSVGMSPPLAAASLAALECMRAEPRRVAALQANGREFLRLANDAGLDTGTGQGFAIIPVITGSSVKAGRLAQALFERGINVQPILHPAVPENNARLRFFLCSEHSAEQIRGTVRAIAEESARL